VPEWTSLVEMAVGSTSVQPVKSLSKPGLLIVTLAPKAAGAAAIVAARNAAVVILFMSSS